MRQPTDDIASDRRHWGVGVRQSCSGGRRFARNVGVFLILLIGSLSFAADEPVKKKTLSLQDLINSAAGSPPEATSVAGVRGLEETAGKLDTQARDYAAIERLEHVVVHEDELKQFMDEGKLK